MRKFCFWLLVTSSCIVGCARDAAKPKAVRLTAAQLDGYAGQFQDKKNPDQTLNFYRTGDHLTVETERRPPTELKALSATEFTDADSSISAWFTLGADGRATAVRTAKAADAAVYARVGEPVKHEFKPYVRSEAMVPMRDGVKLHVVIVRPTWISAAIPILLERTPYGVDKESASSVYTRRPELAHAGYIFVFEDIRGRYKSEGSFQMNRPLADHSKHGAIDESTDAYDTIDWLVKNVPSNNGRVGVLGTSYDGFTAMMAGIDPHPAVKAISPQAPMINTWLGDDFFHNGAFRETYGYDYGMGLESSKENTPIKYDKDTYDAFLEAGSFDALTRKTSRPDLPTWVAFREHPTYDAYWRSRGVDNFLTKLTVPTLTVGGYYDQEDMWGPQTEYAKLEPLDRRGVNFLVLGPWCHGQWSATTRHLGALDWTQPIGDQFRAQIEAPFFAKYLKDEPGFDLKDTASYQTGSDTWKRYTQWPPPAEKGTNLYLAESGQLTWAKPGHTDAMAKVSYTAEPKNPVPYSRRPLTATYAPDSHWRTWMVEDQRAMTARPDVAKWQTAQLKAPLTITGDITADIFASTSGTDADWVVKVIDVYPENDPDPAMRGYQLMTNAEIFRGRYRKSFEKPDPVGAGEVSEYTWSLHGVDHVFLPGHRVMITIQSTWFPLYDRNPGKYVNNIMLAKPDDFLSTTETVFMSADHPSHVVLPVINK
jgi:putative CocE/NonD family hydrolase